MIKVIFTVKFCCTSYYVGSGGAKEIGEITVRVTGITAELKVEVEPANKNEYTPLLAVFDV